VQELLRCLLLPEPCRLALDLGVISRLDSHYTGVFAAGPGGHTIVSPTVEFARRLLQPALDTLPCPRPPLDPWLQHRLCAGCLRGGRGGRGG
jgi:hypothetical protein